MDCSYIKCVRFFISYFKFNVFFIRRLDTIDSFKGKSLCKYGLRKFCVHCVYVSNTFTSLGMDARAEDNNTDERGIRFNTLHVRGVNDMSTQRVFDYFAEFAASAIEWVDDASCMLKINYIFKDQLYIHHY